jgi:hypothetical protein
MTNPDWGRTLVNTGRQGAPVGDPTQWGAQVITQIPAVADTTISAQIIQAATVDAYSRSWAIVGTLSLPFALWGAPGVYTGDPTSTPYTVWLEVIMGVGQTQIVHNIVLSAGDQNPTVGLCTTQSSALYTGPIPAPGLGPYQPAFPPLGATHQVRPFAAIGALVGHTIAIRAVYQIGMLAPGLPAASTIAILLTPFAAGQGL